MPKFFILLSLSIVGCICILFSWPEVAAVADGDAPLSRQNEAPPALGPEFMENFGAESPFLPGRAPARKDDWNQPMPLSEELYVANIRKWLDGLERKQREHVRSILLEAHPRLHALRVAIRDKKTQLATMSFGRDTRPETLPRIGQELQILRASLREELLKVGDRLREEAGISLGPLGGDGLWLVPPDGETPPAKKPHSDNGEAPAIFPALAEIWDF